MAIQAQNIKLNVVPGGIIPVVHVSQFDENRTLTFTLYDGENVASLPAGTTAKIDGTKPSRKAFSYNASISNNIVTVNTQTQMTIEPGTVECKIVLTSGSQIIGSAMFFMEVEQAGVQDDADISETVLPAYMEAGRQNMLNAEAWAKGTKDGVAVGSTEPQYHNNAKYWAGVAETSGQGWVDTIDAAGQRNVNSVNSAGQTWNTTLNTTGQEWSNITRGYMNEARTSANNAATSAARAQSSETQSSRNVDISRQYSEKALENAENGREWAKSWATYSYNPDRYGHDSDNAQYWSDRAHYFYDKTVTLASKMQEKLNSVITVIKMLIGSIYITTQSGDHLVTQSGDSLVLDFAENMYLATASGDRVLTENDNNITVSR